MDGWKVLGLRAIYYFMEAMPQIERTEDIQWARAHMDAGRYHVTDITMAIEAGDRESCEEATGELHAAIAAWKAEKERMDADA